jgi:PAS domain S-box-containing protein
MVRSLGGALDSGGELERPQPESAGSLTLLLHSAVMENITEGLYIVDQGGVTVMMNSAASRLLGWSSEELVGRRIHDVIHYQHLDRTPRPASDCQLIQAYQEQRTIHALEDAFTCKDGSIMPVTCSVAPLAAGGDLRGAVVLFRDITVEKAERERAQHELQADKWLGRIRDALDESRLRLYAQPIIPLTGGVQREELLLRMVSRDGEIIAPGAFLPTAEKYGLIGEIDRWVVTEAIRLAAGGRPVEINLSADSVGDEELLGLISRELSETGADPSKLVFEITETALMQDFDAGEAFARSLAGFGCELALDDFGTGFGSFTYLKLPVMYLKIDLEFVRHLGSNPGNQHLVKSIVYLARGFGHQTIAEGVEDAETLALLRVYGVDYAQGFHIGLPAPAEGRRLSSARSSSNGRAPD